MPSLARKLFLYVGLLVALLGIRAGAEPPVHAETGPPGRLADVFGGHSSSQIVIRLSDPAFRKPAMQERIRRHGRHADPSEALTGEFRATTAQWRVGRIRPAFSDEFSDPQLASRYGLDRTYIVEAPFGSDTPAMARAFAGLRDDVDLATVDSIGGVAGEIPSDPFFGVQWAMHNTGQSGGVADADIDAPEAWAVHTGDLGSVTIAIIDSGVNSHVEYGTNAAPYPNGRMVQGKNTADPLFPTLTTDNCPHGTHVAGIAAAAGNNGVGVAGVNWGAYIMPVRVLLTSQPCNGYASALADGIRYAADHGAHVANMSLQYYGLTLNESVLLNNAVNYGFDRGMLLIGAAGNNHGGGVGVVAYPAKLLGCMGVSGTTRADVRATTATTSAPSWESNYGNEIDVAAPGDDIYSTWVSNSYVYSVGTSMATPHVTGLAALIKSYAPGLTNTHLESILTESADDKGPVGWDNQYGFGRINAYNALILAEEFFDVVLSGDPDDGAIDARKPTDADGSNVYGWNSVDITFGRITFDPGPEDFTVSQDGGFSVPPSVATVVQVSSPVLRVGLDAMIEPKAWTTITHTASATSVRIGFLPGDVTGDGVSDGADLASLATMLKGSRALGPEHSTDIDRTRSITGADLLELADLLAGNGEYEPYLGMALP